MAYLARSRSLGRSWTVLAIRLSLLRFANLGLLLVDHDLNCLQRATLWQLQLDPWDGSHLGDDLEENADLSISVSHVRSIDEVSIIEICKDGRYQSAYLLCVGPALDGHDGDGMRWRDVGWVLKISRCQKTRMDQMLADGRLRGSVAFWLCFEEVGGGGGEASGLRFSFFKFTSRL